VERYLLSIHPGVGQIQPAEIRYGPLDECLRIHGLTHVGHLKDRATSIPLDGPYDASPSRALRLPMTSEAPAFAIAKAVALPMPVPPPGTTLTF
jgi:hypothetical protein